MGPPSFTGCFGQREETRQWFLPRMWPQDATARMRHAPVYRLIFDLLQRSDGQWNLVFQEPQQNKGSESFWCALETKLSAFLVSQQKVQEDPSTVHSFWFLLPCVTVQYSQAVIKSCQTSAVFVVRKYFTYIYTPNQNLSLMNITRKQFIGASLAVGSVFRHLWEMPGGLWLLQQTMCPYKEFDTELTSFFCTHCTEIMTLNKKQLMLS